MNTNGVQKSPNLFPTCGSMMNNVIPSNTIDKKIFTGDIFMFPA